MYVHDAMHVTSSTGLGRDHTCNSNGGGGCIHGLLTHRHAFWKMLLHEPVTTDTGWGQHGLPLPRHNLNSHNQASQQHVKTRRLDKSCGTAC